MKIDEEKCPACARCNLFCPVGAIRVKEKKIIIDADDCLEWGRNSLHRSRKSSPGVLAQPCVCGVVNTSRVKELLQAMV